MESRPLRESSSIDVLPVLKTTVPLKTQRSAHTFVSEGLLKHFPRFSSSFPEFEAKFHTHMLFFQVLHFHYLKFLLLAIILQQSVTKSPFSSFTVFCSRLVTHHEVHDASLQVSDIFILLLVSSSSISDFRYSDMLMTDVPASYIV